MRRIPAAGVAQAILRAIRAGRSEVYVKWTDWLFASASRHFPRATNWFVAWGRSWVRARR